MTDASALAGASFGGSTCSGTGRSASCREPAGRLGEKSSPREQEHPRVLRPTPSESNREPHRQPPDVEVAIPCRDPALVFCHIVPLYVVATPIGNLQDLTARAREVLAACDAVVAEDTRHTGQLLKNLGIEKKP